MRTRARDRDRGLSGRSAQPICLRPVFRMLSMVEGEPKGRVRSMMFNGAVGYWLVSYQQVYSITAKWDRLSEQRFDIRPTKDKCT